MNYTVASVYPSDNTLEWAAMILQADWLAGVKTTEKCVLSIFSVSLPLLLWITVPT